MIQRFSEAFSLLWNNLGLFSAIILTVWLPGNALLDFLASQYPEGNDLVFVRLTIFLEGFFGPIYIGALVFALFKIKNGESVTYGEAISVGFKRWGSLFAARFVVGILTLIGFVAFIIPGIIIAVRYSMVDCLVILEKKGSFEALKQSAVLTDGKRWSIFNSVLLFVITFLILSFTIYFPLGFFESLDILPIEIALDCLLDVAYSVIQIVIFLFYWEVTHENSTDSLVENEDKIPINVKNA